MSLTWQEAITQYPLIGGEIEVQETNCHHRGSIRSVHIEKDAVVFTLGWHAHYVRGSYELDMTRRQAIRISLSSQPMETADYLETLDPSKGLIMVFPEGVSRTDVRAIRGLAL